MATFEPWLAQLAAAGKGPVTLYATRGRAWRTTITLAGNWTGATMRGQIRLEPDAAASLASFTITGPVVVGDSTQFTLSLAAGAGANSTGVLPADSAGENFIELPFDLLLTPSGGVEDLLFGGNFILIGRITE